MAGRREAGWSGRERTRESFRPLGLPGDGARVRIVTVGPDVIAYTVQYEAWIEGRHRNVVRYDNAHGAPHLDILDWSGAVLKKEWRPATSNNAALDEALNELKANWRTYRADFIGRKP